MDDVLERAQQLFAVVRRGAAPRAARGRRDLRRARPPRQRHRRHGRDLRRARCGITDRYGISRCFMFCLDEPDRHPAFRAAERPHARVRGALGRPPHPVRPARPDRGADRGGDALPRPRRARDQAPPARAALPAERRAARADLRARGRAPRADPDPRRPRAAADRRPPRAARRRVPGRAADHRARRHRRPGRRWPTASAARPASSSTPRCGARSTCSTSTGHVPPEQVRLRLRLPVRPAAGVAADRAADGAARRARRGRGAQHARPATPAASPTASRRSSRRAARAATPSRSR